MNNPLESNEQQNVSNEIRVGNLRSSLEQSLPGWSEGNIALAHVAVEECIEAMSGGDEFLARTLKDRYRGDSDSLSTKVTKKLGLTHNRESSREQAIVVNKLEEAITDLGKNKDANRFVKDVIPAARQSLEDCLDRTIDGDRKDIKVKLEQLRDLSGLFFRDDQFALEAPLSELIGGVGALSQMRRDIESFGLNESDQDAMSNIIFNYLLEFGAQAYAHNLIYCYEKGKFPRGIDTQLDKQQLKAVQPLIQALRAGVNGLMTGNASSFNKNVLNRLKIRSEYLIKQNQDPDNNKLYQEQIDRCEQLMKVLATKAHEKGK